MSHVPAQSHEDIVDALSARIPEVDRLFIDRVVTDLEGRYANARVRNFVSVLVAREARDVLTVRLSWRATG